MAFGNVYLEHMRQARELTGLPVDGASGQSGCYAGLKARNAEVCRLLEQNNLFLIKVIIICDLFQIASVKFWFFFHNFPSYRHNFDIFSFRHCHSLTNNAIIYYSMF